MQINAAALAKEQSGAKLISRKYIGIYWYRGNTLWLGFSDCSHLRNSLLFIEDQRRAEMEALSFVSAARSRANAVDSWSRIFKNIFNQADTSEALL